MSQGRPVILVIDDDPTARLFVRGALEPAGMIVTEASGGQESLTVFEKLTPDLVVLDIVMPEMDGYLTCSRIRSLPRGKRIPILIMTGLDDPNSIALAYEHGATDFINKPVHATILCHHIRYMLRTSNVLQALVRSEARLELAQRIARIGNWDWNPRTNRFSMSNGSVVWPGSDPRTSEAPSKDSSSWSTPTIARRSGGRSTTWFIIARCATSTIGSSSRTAPISRFICRPKEYGKKKPTS